MINGPAAARPTTGRPDVMRSVILTFCFLATLFPRLATAENAVADMASFLDTGGPVVMVLLGMSVLALTLMLLKLIQFRRCRVGATQPAREALALCRAGRPEEALERALRGQQRALAEPAIREEVLRYGTNALFELRRGLRPLEVIGSLAPLLGLLGTVLGMIEAFRQLEAAGNQVNPAILSGGIWEALLTTAVGLCVAIPVVAVLNWLERRVDYLAHEMDDVVTQAFTVDLDEGAPAVLSATAPNDSGSRVHAAP